MQKKLPRIQQLQRKLEQSQRDKFQLSKSIEQLNECYESKIAILQNTIQAYQNRIEELLEWKKQYINKQLSSTAKYQQENKKLLTIIDQLYATFDQEKLKLENDLKFKDESIQKIQQQKDELLLKSQESEQRIDKLVREHMKQIEQYKKQLVLLKDQIIECSNEQSRSRSEINAQSQIVESIQLHSCSTNQNQKNVEEDVNVLRQLKDMNKKQSQTTQETRVKQLVYRSPVPNFKFLSA